MRNLEVGLVGAVAVIMLACNLEAQLALTGNDAGASGLDEGGTVEGGAGSGGTIQAAGGTIQAAGGTIQAAGGTSSTATDDFEFARQLVLDRYPECASYATETYLEVKNGIVRFDCGTQVDGPEYYLDLESGQLISTCEPLRDETDDELGVRLTMCPPPAFGDCAAASSRTAELPQCQAIDFCLADSITIYETEGIFECEATDGPNSCSGTSDRQIYVYRSDRIELRFSVDRGLVGQFEAGSMWASVDLESVVLSFPEQSRLLREVDPDAFAGGEVERADFFAEVAIAEEVSAQSIDFTTEGKLHISVAMIGDQAGFITSSSNYDTCVTDDMLGFCECSYEKSIAARINLELPVESEL